MSAAIIGYCVWLVWTDAPAYQYLVRLYVDKQFLKQTLSEWGILAPLLFIALQALQVIISPIPGEATGILGGFLFGQWLGLLYSTIGLTIGSLVSFTLGRWLGAHYVKNLVKEETWQKLGFIVEAEGAIVCFIIFLIPGLPKDIVCYLFGLSPMPFWVFAIVSSLGRVPGTLVLSAQGAKVTISKSRCSRPWSRPWPSPSTTTGTGSWPGWRGGPRPMTRPPARERPRGRELDIEDRTTYSRRHFLHGRHQASERSEDGERAGWVAVFLLSPRLPTGSHELNRGATGRTSRPPVAM